MPESYIPAVIALNHASDATVRRALLLLCDDQEVLRKTLNALCDLQPELHVIIIQALKAQLAREEEEERIAAVVRENAARLAAAARERQQAEARALAWRRERAKAIEAEEARARAKARGTVQARTTSSNTSRANITHQTRPQNGHSLTYPEKHRLFPHGKPVNQPRQYSAPQAPPASTIRSSVAPSNNKRKVPSELAVCVECGAAFDTADNNHAVCQHHDGSLECDDESDFWCDYYDYKDGPARDSEESKHLFPGGWVWSCCGGDGQQVGCKLGRHTAPSTRRRV
ncbi:hypothetical protein V8F20_005670 [Naviculisporaceae sp. PSN 640]